MKIQVSPKLIEKASRLFNATLKEVINELLQNSRRAGASRIDITAMERDGQQWVVIADDGCGFRDEATILLGESGWATTNLPKSAHPYLGLSVGVTSW